MIWPHLRHRMEGAAAGAARPFDARHDGGAAICSSLFGFAINTDVRHIPRSCTIRIRVRETRDIVRRMEATGFYDVLGSVDGYEALEFALRRASACRARLPPLSARTSSGGRPTKLQLIVDGSDPQTVASARDTALA